MQTVGGIIVAVLVVAGEILMLGGGSTPEPEQRQITVVQGKQLKREPFNFIPYTPAPVEAPVADKVVSRVVSAPAPVPAPSPAPAPVPEPAPLPAETPVSVCLGKFAGTACSYTDQGVTKTGTCVTPAWSPLTCVAH